MGTSSINLLEYIAHKSVEQCNKHNVISMLSNEHNNNNGKVDKSLLLFLINDLKNNSNLEG